MSPLFQPLSIRGVTLKNRIAVSPMCQYSSVDGFSNDWHLVHLGSRAVGGAGLVMSEATSVSPEGRISIADLGIWKDEHIEGLRNITRFIAHQGSVPGIQLAHAGRKGSYREPWKGDTIIPESEGGWNTVAPSAIPFSPNSTTPVALSVEGITKVVNDFRDAARRALEAGFNVAEIHAAHGYLIHQFLSPLTNHRTDMFGGSLENRMRLLLDVVESVRTVWPDSLPLFVRISGTDWMEGGWTPEDSVALARRLGPLGVDLIDCSSGGLVPGAKIPLGPGYQVPISTKVRSEANILTGAVGLIVESRQAEAIIAEGRADLVIMAREFLRDPYFPLRAAHELGHDVTWPVQYERAKRKKS